MREILLLEDDTTLGMGIQLALQDPDVTIALGAGAVRKSRAGAGTAGAEKI